MRIDGHQHFWKYDPQRDTWITDSMARLKNDFLPEELEPHLQQHQFDGCIAVQADQSEEETDFLLNMASEFDFIKGVVGWLDLQGPDLSDSLERYSRHPKFKGLRHIVQAEPPGFMLKDNFLRGLDALGTYNLTYDMLIYPYQLSEALSVVRQFPDQKFVLDHMAKPKVRTKEIEIWSEQMSALSTYKNVYCKVSGLVTEADWNHWNIDDFTPYLEFVFQHFSSSRLIFGSDWPVCLVAAGYDEVVEIIEKYISHLTPVEKEAIMGNNAKYFYDLK